MWKSSLDRLLPPGCVKYRPGVMGQYIFVPRARVVMRQRSNMTQPDVWTRRDDQFRLALCLTKKVRHVWPPPFAWMRPARMRGKRRSDIFPISAGRCGSRGEHQYLSHPPERDERSW